MPVSDEPLGLQFRKLDLHCHTTESDGSSTPTEVVKAAYDHGLDALAITDHNSGSGIDEAIAVGHNLGIAIFPGVELTVTGGKRGIHLVALFDPSSDGDRVKALLGRLQISPETWGRDEAVSTMSPAAAIDAISKLGGIACAAHASSSKGVFKEMRGQQRIALARNEGLIAVELKSLDGSTAEFLRDSNSDYGRTFALYQASDAHKAQEVGRRFTYFKMGEVSLGSLKQCFYNPDTRIRRMESPPPEIEGYRIERVSFRRGFLDGQSISFHSGLNCILGGKGVGKSLIIEFIRFVLDQACIEVDEISQDHTEKLESCLGMNGEVNIEISSGAESNFTVTRRFDGNKNPILIRHNGKDIGDASPSELFSILAYSQNEAISVSRNHRAQLSLVDSFVDSTRIVREQTTHIEALQTLDAVLAKSMAAADDLTAHERDVSTCQAKLADVVSKIDNPVFSEMQTWEAVNEHIGNSDGLASKVEAALVDAGDSLAALDPGEQSTIQGHGAGFANKILTHATVMKSDVESLVSKAKEVAAVKRSAIDDTRQQFATAMARARVRYMAAIAEGGNQEELEGERDRLSGELRELRQEQTSLEELAQRRQELLNERSSLLSQLDAAGTELFVRRKRKYEEITEQSDGKIRLSIERAADSSKFRDRLDDLSTGTNLLKRYMSQIADSSSPVEFVNSVIDRDSARIASWCDMRDEQASTFIGFLLSLADRSALLSLSYDYVAEDKPRIEYRKADGTYAEISRLSVGQKCSALVMIALADQRRTVVLDQPEDSLDVISVYEDVTRTLRSGKDSRQFIVTTHNPNVAVTSDTDMFYVVGADADRGWIEAAGAMDAEKLRGRVMRQLEGGPEPYDLRRRKYQG